MSKDKVRVSERFALDMAAFLEDAEDQEQFRSRLWDAAAAIDEAVEMTEGSDHRELVTFEATEGIDIDVRGTATVTYNRRSDDEKVEAEVEEVEFSEVDDDDDEEENIRLCDSIPAMIGAMTSMVHGKPDENYFCARTSRDNLDGTYAVVWNPISGDWRVTVRHDTDIVRMETGLPTRWKALDVCKDALRSIQTGDIEEDPEAEFTRRTHRSQRMGKARTGRAVNGRTSRRSVSDDDDIEHELGVAE